MTNENDNDNAGGHDSGKPSFLPGRLYNFARPCHWNTGAAVAASKSITSQVRCQLDVLQNLSFVSFEVATLKA